MNDTKLARAHDFVMFGRHGGVKLEATENARLLLLGGEPIAEPVVQYGPFVMSTEEEIYQAVGDYRSGRMGRPSL